MLSEQASRPVAGVMTEEERDEQVVPQCGRKPLVVPPNLLGMSGGASRPLEPVVMPGLTWDHVMLERSVLARKRTCRPDLVAERPGERPARRKLSGLSVVSWHAHADLTAFHTRATVAPTTMTAPPTTSTILFLR